MHAKEQGKKKFTKIVIAMVKVVHDVITRDTQSHLIHAQSAEAVVKSQLKHIIDTHLKHRPVSR